MNGKKTLAIVTVLTVTLTLLSYGAGKTKKPTGKELFKQKCRSCHVKDSDAGEITPISLIQMQWERFFDSKYEVKHKEVKDPSNENKAVTDGITADELKKIRKFAIDHAADSEQPETCG